MKVLGAVLLLVGIVGAIHGPTDKEYLEDWAAWLLFVIVGLLGFLMLTL